MSPEESPRSATLRLRRAEAALRRAVQPLLSSHGITFEQWQVVASLAEEPGQRMTDLADSAMLPAATLTRHVDRLVGRALVIRRIDPGDKRRVLVALSARGEQLAHRVRALEDRAAGRVGPELAET